ncbi:hypothetical protein SEPCBS57363_002188 [Sporothrix epigloea]|uniref:Uncharacterized protein n=1 Tax=Sporothrix epigloea TaxID=1892477 RepID=A0ABP0DEN6_9PEZI
MEDPDVAWPAWKFGMKRDALFTTLHDQYNTFQSNIQDPDAFHHDVYEIANEAASTVEFHNLLATRRDQRLRELNESLESASFEIIANPALVGTSQWEHALQLFRTRSLDSLVRYFASYLPSTHPWRTSLDDKDEQIIRVPSPTKPFFEDGILTKEPTELPHSLSRVALRNELPPSPRSLTTYSDDMGSPEAHELYCLNTLTPARTLSFSDSDDIDRLFHAENSDSTHEVCRKVNAKTSFSNKECSLQHEDDTWQSIGPNTPVSNIDDTGFEVVEDEFINVHDQDSAVALQQSSDESSSKLPTPPTPVTHPIGCDANTNVNICNPTATTNATTTSRALRRSSSRRRPLQSCYTADDADHSCSPLPVSIRVRHRSVSPSRPWPLMHADPGHYHPAVPSGIVANRSASNRASERSFRLGRRHRRLETVAAPAITRSASSSGLGRRRLEQRFDKVVLPRIMRNRQRQHRESAASTAVDQQRR